MDSSHLETINRHRSASIRWIAEQVLRGIVFRILGLLRRNRDAGSDNVRQFFKKSRNLENEHHVIDLTDPSYLILCKGFEQLIHWERARPVSVIDLGCGSCTFHKYLHDEGFVVSDYVGVDLYVSESDRQYARDNHLTLIESDICRDGWTEGLSANFVVAINCFCYVGQLDPLVERATSIHLKTESYFLVIDPMPSLVWETYFCGITVFLRQPRELDRILERHGWQIQGRHVLHATRFAGKFLFPMTSLNIYVKQKYLRNSDGINPSSDS